MQRKRFLNELKITDAAILLFISAFLAFTFLPPGTILGGGDVGIPTHMPERILKVISHSWWETQSTGTTNPMSLTAIPLYIVFTFLHGIGFSSAMIQKAFFFAINFGASFSIYLVSRHYKFSRKLSILSGIFYISNLMTLSVWHRGVHNSMLMLLLAPLTLLLLVKGISSKKFTSTLYITFASIAMSYSFGSPALIFGIWLVWGSYIFASLANSNNRDEFLFTLKYGLTLLVVWVVGNSWWLLYFLESSKYVFGQLDSGALQAASTDVLVALKEQTRLGYVFRGISKFQYLDLEEWGSFYKNPIVIILTWLPVVLSLYSIFRKKFFKNSLFIFSLSLLLAVVFISKGINQPFGWFNKFLYESIPALAPLRNPYEKIGIFLPTAYSFLLIFGSKILLDRYKKFSSLIFLLLLALNIFLSWPLWTGKTFEGTAKKAIIKIPSYYGEADSWLSSRLGGSRVLHLPLAKGESVDYDWGYSGIEPSQLFFQGSSISYKTGLTAIDFIHDQLLLHLHNKDNEILENYFRQLNIGWVVMHNETDWKPRGLESSENINKWLANEQDFLVLENEIGPLSFWKVNNFNPSHFSYVDRITFLDTGDEIDLIKNQITIPTNTSLYSGNQILTKLQSFTGNFVIYPDKKISFPGNIEVDKENALNELSYVRYTPSSPFYLGVRFKEYFGKLAEQTHPVTRCLDLAGKRLVETVKLLESGDNKLADENLLIYQNTLKSCDQKSVSLKSYTASEPRLKEVLGKLFRHIVVSENHIKEPIVRNKNINFIKEFLSSSGIYPKFAPIEVYGEGLLYIFTYNIPSSGEYSATFESDQLLSDFNASITQKNDEKFNINLNSNSNVKTMFKQGYNELHIEISDIKQYDFKPIIGGGVVEINFDSSEYEINSSKADSEISINLNTVTPNEAYEVSFEYLTMQGSPMKIEIIEDVDILDEDGEVIPTVNYQPAKSDYYHYWNMQSINYEPDINANSAEIIISAVPWNNCLTFFSSKACENKNTYSSFNKDSVIRIRNLSINKVFNEPLKLYNLNTNIADLGRVDINWTKKTPAKFELTLSNQETPYILKFAETFHPVWVIKDKDGRKIDTTHFQIDGYANAWLIEEKLPENLIVEFDLEQKKQDGYKYFSIGFLIITCIIFYNRIASPAHNKQLKKNHNS